MPRVWRDRNGNLRDTSALRVPVLLLLPMLLLVLSQYITIQSVGGTVQWLLAHPAAVGSGWLVMALFLTVLYGITGSLFWGCALLTVPSVVLSFVSFYENMVNGVPMRISDFFMVTAAGSLLNFLGELKPTAAGVAAVALTLLLLSLLRRLNRGCGRLTTRARLLMTVWGAAAIILVTLPQIKTVPLWEQEETVAEAYERQGFLLGLYNGIAPTMPQPPENYGQEQMEGVLAGLMEEQTPAVEEEKQVQPTVIFFMSESFFDVSRLPNVEFSRDPVPIYHALARENTSGYFFSNTYGGGTGNVEMEVFTGLSSYMLGVHVTPTTMNEALYDTLPSLVKLLKGRGYQTAVVHSYTDELYNRATTFPAIGFDTMCFEDDFPEDAEQKGGYLSDGALVDQAISIYEGRDRDKPMFLYVLSMENHQPYPGDKFEHNSGITAQGKGLTAEEQEILDTIVTGIYDADASLGKMVRYFSRQEEPVMLVFWGDHLPSLYTGTETGTVYTSLGFVGANDLAGLTEEELKRMVSTDYLIWTNYEKEPLPDQDTSSLMLGVQVLDRLGYAKTPFFDYVSRLGEDMLLYREKLFLAADGTPNREIPAELMPEIERYGAVLYDMLYGEQYITERLNELPE